VRDVIRRRIGKQVEHDCAHRGLDHGLLVLQLARRERIDEVRVRRRLRTCGRWTRRRRTLRWPWRRRLQIAEQQEECEQRNHSAIIGILLPLPWA